MRRDAIPPPVFERLMSFAVERYLLDEREGPTAFEETLTVGMWEVEVYRSDDDDDAGCLIFQLDGRGQRIVSNACLCYAELIQRAG